MTDDLLLYGAYGYIGSLVVERAIDRGFVSIRAGRRAESLETQATEHGLNYTTFNLEHPHTR